jgi:hypothetical protein
MKTMGETRAGQESEWHRIAGERKERPASPRRSGQAPDVPYNGGGKLLATRERIAWKYNTCQLLFEYYSNGAVRR